MTSRSTLGGYEQSTGSLHRGSTHDYLPQFQTYSSAAHEPDAISPLLTNPKWSANLAASCGSSIHGDIFDPSIKAIAGTLIFVGLAVILAWASFFIWP